MQPQTFVSGDLAVVAMLVALEGLLSADNALVLAMMVKHLDKTQQRRALTYGLGGAFAFRFVATLLASTIIRFWWLQSLGAAYLIFLPAKHFLTPDSRARSLSSKATFWQTVIAVEITDIVFALDSVLAGIAFVGSRQDKIWVVFLGAAIGIVMLRLAAGLFIRLLEHYPKLDAVAYMLVGWVGFKLAILSVHSYGIATNQSTIPEMSPLVFWTGIGLISSFGTLVAMRDPHSDRTVAELRDAASDIEAVENLFDEESATPS